MCCWIRNLAALALTLVVVLSLSGCGGGSGSSPMLTSRIFGGPSKILIAQPIIGAPQKVSDELTQALIVAGQARGLTLMPSGEASYIMRGYLVATTELRGAKISYIWDVNDAKGRRVTRISGDETLAKRPRSDPWSAADADALRQVAASTTAKLAGGLGGSSAPVAASSPAPSGAPTATAATAARPAAPSGPVMALVSPVAGAPGDGQTSLTAAIKKRLNAGGVKLASSSSGNVYTVKGSVKVTDAAGGKESIRIDWTVLNPNGTKRGTVSQQNMIPKGSLNGPWGAIADAAAADAAKGIIKLLPST